MKTMKIADETHGRLLKIVGELTSRNGERKTFNDAIEELIIFWNENHK